MRKKGLLDLRYRLMVALIGDHNVGKNTYADRIAHLSQTEHFGETIDTLGIEIFFRQVSDYDTLIQIRDITGQNRFHRKFPAYSKYAQGLIAVCDMGRVKTVKDLDVWFKRAYEAIGKRVPGVIIGNIKNGNCDPETEKILKSLYKEYPRFIIDIKKGDGKKLTEPIVKLVELIRGIKTDN